MPCIPHLGHLPRERLDGVGWREKGSSDAVSLQQLQDPIQAHGGAVDAAGDVGGVLLAAVLGVDPRWG